MKDFDLYLFDFDGTLVDTYESLTYVFGQSYKAVGVTISREDVARLMRTSLEAGYESVHGPDDEEHKKIYVDNIVYYLDDEHTLKLSKTYPEVKKVLLALKEKGKKLGIVTSNSKKHVLDVLRYIDLDKSLFDVIIGNGETPKRKPNPEPVLVALEILNINADKACYVGDAIDDMLCGEGAKVTPILVDRYHEYEKEKYHIIQTLDEIL